MTTLRNGAAEREEIEALLPWHAAGTLNRSDAERVERAIAADSELARRFGMVREELSETIQLNESLGAPSARALEKLFMKIDAEPVRRQTAVSATSSGLAARISDFFASLSPRTLALSGGLAAVAILLQAGILATMVIANKPAGTTFETASHGAAPAAEGAYVLLRFAPEASSADITKLLETSKATIAGGPAAGGLYRVKVAVTGLPKEELARIVRQFQESKAVGFAAPAN